MKLKPGDKIENLSLPTIDGGTFNINELNGKKALISFYRFASCPFCNLRINKIIRNYKKLDSNFKIVAIFDSSLKKLSYVNKHDAPFTIAADEERAYFKQYNVERSVLKFIKASILRSPSLLMAMLKGYVPIEFKASLTTVPVDILLNEDGTISKAYYGNDTGDHLSFDEIKDFSKA
tara:strand:+ start:3185 stop:3715 length:531 start_codon:yes stop_codon:yes gene_type:complete